MENFYICYSENIDMLVTREGKCHSAGIFPILYSNNACITYQNDQHVLLLDASIQDVQDYKGIHIPFEVLFFKNFMHDAVLIAQCDESSDSVLSYKIYKLNKFKKQLEFIGEVTNRILNIFSTETSFLILTTEEFLYFDSYCELKGHAKCNIPPQFTEYSGGSSHFSSVENISVAFGSDSFLLICHSPGLFYAKLFSLEFKELQDLSNWEIRSAVFQEKYNRFCCIANSSLIFIEPNGLEQAPANPIEEFKPNHPTQIFMMKALNEDIFVISDGYKAFLYFMKNFKWYSKACLNGRVVGIEGCNILTINNLAAPEVNITRHIDQLSLTNSIAVTRNTVSRKFLDGLVVDGKFLCYTSFGEGLIPPPYYHTRVDTAEHIVGIYLVQGDNKVVYVVHSGDIVLYEIQGVDLTLISSEQHKVDITRRNIKEQAVNASELFLILSDLIKIDEPNATKHPIISGKIIKGNIPVQNITSFQAFTIVQSHNDFFVIKPDGTSILYRSTPGILQILNVAGELIILFKSGRIVWSGLTFHLSLSFDTEVRKGPEPNTLCVFSNNTLQILERDDGSIKLRDRLANVVSFCVFSDYLIYNIKNKMIIFSKGKILDSSYVDADQNILQVVDNKIISQTRFGSLESLNCRIFVKDRILRHIRENEARKAAELCDRNNINYGIFFQDGKCPLNMIQSFSENQTIRLISEVEWPKGVLLECEHLERLKRAYSFDYPAKFTQSGAKDYISNDVLLGFIDLDKLRDNVPKPSAAASGMLTTITTPAISSSFIYKMSPGSMDYLSRSIASLENILRVLSPKNDLSILINLLIMIDRVDLVFYTYNVPKALKYLKNRISKDIILREAIKTSDMNIISVAYRECQSDISKLIQLCPDNNLYQRFLLLDHIEEWSSALAYLILSEQDITERLKKYTIQHDLFDDLLFYHSIGLTDRDIYLFVAEHSAPSRAFLLQCAAGRQEQALDTAKSHLLWREALKQFNTDEVALTFVELSLKHKMFLDAAVISEEYRKDFAGAFEYYLQAEEFDCAYRIADPEMMKKLVDKLHLTTKNALVDIEESWHRLEKYINRINVVKERIEGSIEQSTTTFSRTSAKSARKALLRDRPGGVYEYEYVLNKIREIMIDMNEQRIKADMLVRVARATGTTELISLIKSGFDRELGRITDELWCYEKPGADESVPKVEKPIISKLQEIN